MAAQALVPGDHGAFFLLSKPIRHSLAGDRALRHGVCAGLFMSKAAMYPVLRNWSPESAVLIARWQKALEEFHCLVEECRALVRERKRLLQASDDTRQPPA